MSAIETKLTRNTNVDLSNDAEVEQIATQMHAAFGFDVRECELALHTGKGNVGDAVEHLADGGWMWGKLVSWNWASLTPKCEKLVELTGLPAPQCMKVLQNCAGNEALAARKLAFLPAMP